jgi:hypothetical protein
VAKAANIFINYYMPMTLKVVTLVAVKAAGNMQLVGEYSFFRLGREFLKGVAPEAREFAYRLVPRDNFTVRVANPGFVSFLGIAAGKQ